MEIMTELYAQLEEQLSEIELKHESLITQARLSYQASEQAMQELKKFVAAYEFKDTKEEIRFFREIKPMFYSKLIYFTRQFEIETKRPDGSQRVLRKYLNRQLANIKRYYEDNDTFYKYYRSGATYMDGAYFTRDKFDILVGFDISYFDCDPNFCTSHDYKAAMLLANEQLVIYLNKALLRLNDKRPDDKTAILEELGLNWAEPKVSLIEMIYALHVVGAFYNVKTRMKADVKDIARFFEVCLNIQLGDSVYRAFYDIRLRKKEPTPFIRKMDHELISYIDQVNG